MICLILGNYEDLMKLTRQTGMLFNIVDIRYYLWAFNNKMATHKKDEFTLDDQSISQMAKAMSHPARITIMRILTENPGYTCGEIVDILPLAQATVSHHLKELQDAKLINVVADGKKSRYEINWDSWKSYSVSLTQFLNFVNNPPEHP